MDYVIGGLFAVSTALAYLGGYIQPADKRLSAVFVGLALAATVLALTIMNYQHQ